jgi:hypothetical protein
VPEYGASVIGRQLDQPGELQAARFDPLDGPLRPHFRGAPAIGALAAGIASAHFGLRWPVFFGALLVVAVCLWTYRSRERIAVALSSEQS